MSGEGRPLDVYASLARALDGAPAADESDEDLWTRLEELVDPGEARPALAPDVELKRFSMRWGNDYAMICNPRDLVHYRLEPDEVDLVALMDGSRTVKDIVVQQMGDSGPMEVSSVAELVEALSVGNFLDRPFVDVEEALSGALAPPPTLPRRIRSFFTTLALEWSGADRVVRWLYHHGVKWFYRRWTLAVTVPVAVGGFAAFLYLFHSGRYTIGARSPALESLVLIGLGFVLTFAHELGHASTLVHFGRRVKAAGVAVYFGAPSFYIDSSDTLMLERGERMLQSFAGPYAELVLAGLGTLPLLVVPNWVLAPLLYKFAVLNYLVIFLNLIPLLELDGYWLFSDLIQVTDLRPRSIAFLEHGLWEKLRRRSKLTVQEVGLTTYATVGVAFAIFAFYTAFFFWREVFGGLVSALWNDGLLTRLLLLALILVVGGPLVRASIDGARALAGRIQALWRRSVFRLQRSWRVEAVQLIDASPLFEDVPEDVLGELAGLARLRTLPRGKPVFRQGDLPDAFYVVRQGDLEVVEEEADGGERVLKTLGRGDSFGELGLVEGTARSATVRAAGRAEVFEFDRGAFDGLMADMVNVPTFAPTLQAAAEIERLPCFAHLRTDEVGELLKLGTWQNASPGETIISQGDEGDAFYAVESGQLEVSKDGTFLRSLGAGAHFGEVALLEDVPRTSSVTATTRVRLFRLGRPGFDQLLRRAFGSGRLTPHPGSDRVEPH
jgi:CRP-like cAMP-binding protein